MTVPPGPDPRPDGDGAPEQLLGGRYALRSLVARGGMGDVWRAEDTVLGRPVAVKLLRAEHVDDPDFLARFRAEARHAAGLGHPAVAGVYDYGEATDDSGRSGTQAAWLVMELVDGRPLSALLEAEGRLPAARVLRLVRQVADGLAAAHRAGVVHRDVKPGNVVVRDDDVVKVTDFGIARAADGGGLTRAGVVLGTAYYLSPEQARGEVATPASDVYALGVVAHEALAGRRPFEGDDPLEVGRAHQVEPVPPLPGDVPHPVADLVRRMLAKDPAERPASAADVGAVARELLDQLATAWPVAEDPPTEAVPVTRATRALPRTDAPPPGPARRPGPPATRPGPWRATTSPPRTWSPRPPGRGAPPPPGGARRAAGPTRPPGSGSRLPLVLLLLAVAGLVVVALLLRGGGDDGPPVTVPEVVGLDAAAAEARLAEVGLGARREEAGDPPAGAAVGQVLQQDPGAGATALGGDEVVLAVVVEPGAVDVEPGELVGRSYDEVRDRLLGAGLSVERRDVTSDDADAGDVVDVNPSGPLPVGTRVVVEVAVAPPQPTPEPSTQDPEPDAPQEPADTGPAPDDAEQPTDDDAALDGEGTP